MEIERIIVGEFQSNCWIVWVDPARVMIIDPGAEAARIAEQVAARGLRPVAYMLTHGHPDHICGLAELNNAYPAPIGMHASDLDWAFDAENSLFLFDVPERPGEVERLLEDGQTWPDIGPACSVLSTPGHTPGSVCFYFPGEQLLFTGDTLFAGSVGRTDLPGGNSDLLASSLACLRELPDDIAVYPGHGPDTTLAEEKQTNYYMQVAGGQER